MNNIETLKQVIREIGQNFKLSAENVNAALRNVGIADKNFSGAITRIEEQAKLAENKFTIAFIGTFSTGKSTIINTLLNLVDFNDDDENTKMIHTDFDPDTAKCVRIINKGDRDYEAELDFDGKLPNEKLTKWSEAIKYTSHVYLNNALESEKAKAKAINEIRYYVDSPLLEVCNILDLPGTASNVEDKKLADKKMMESDCIFWVLSTDQEPDASALENLVQITKVSGKLLPIINVWQDSTQCLFGQFTPESIIDFLDKNCSGFLEKKNSERPVVYYAKEIANAQKKGREINPEWGRDSFIEKIQEILDNIQVGDKASRIHDNMALSFKECRSIIDDINADGKLGDIKSEIDGNKSSLEKQRQMLESTNRLVDMDLDEAAKKQTNEIIDIISASAENFIVQNMQFRLSQLIYMFTKKQKEKMASDLAKDFEENYLRVNSGWLEDNCRDFCNTASTILRGKYIDFAVDLDNAISENDLHISIDDMTLFVDSIADNIQKNLQEKLIAEIAKAVTAAILIAIPGCEIIDTIAVILSFGKGISGFAKNDKLERASRNIVNRVKIQLTQQKYSIITSFKKQSRNISVNFYNQVKDKLEQDMNEANHSMNQLDAVYNAANEFNSAINIAEGEIQSALM